MLKHYSSFTYRIRHFLGSCGALKKFSIICLSTNKAKTSRFTCFNSASLLCTKRAVALAFLCKIKLKNKYQSGVAENLKAGNNEILYKTLFLYFGTLNV